MSNLSYEIVRLLCRVLKSVPLGTNLGLFSVFWALMSGRFLSSRGAVFPALSAMGLAPDQIRRSEAVLSYKSYQVADLVSAWRNLVSEGGRWQPHEYEGFRPVSGDLTGFYRPHLRDCFTKHYSTQSEKAQPALVYGLCVEVGSVGKMRLGVPRLLLEQQADETQAALQSRLVAQAAPTLSKEEVLVLDAGFALSDVRDRDILFLVRVNQNATARRNELPPYCGKGPRPKRGVLVRPLPRTYAKHKQPATPPDKTQRWSDGRYKIKAHLYENLVAADEKPGGQSYRIIVIIDPRYNKPLVVATNLSASASTIWNLYKDRWPIEQLPLAAKQMLGAQRSFVFNQQARYRLPALALLAGNILSYAAATLPAVATGFWDRCCRPTCGRLRRCLEKLQFSDLPIPEGEFRKKASITTHLPKGIAGHRRQKQSIRKAAVLSAT